MIMNTFYTTTLSAIALTLIQVHAAPPGYGADALPASIVPSYGNDNTASTFSGILVPATASVEPVAPASSTFSEIFPTSTTTFTPVVVIQTEFPGFLVAETPLANTFVPIATTTSAPSYGSDAVVPTNVPSYGSDKPVANVIVNPPVAPIDILVPTYGDNTATINTAGCQSAMAAILFEQSNHNGIKHWVDGAHAECRGLDGNDVQSIQMVTEAGGSIALSDVAAQMVKLTFFSDYACSGNIMGTHAGHVTSATGLLGTKSVKLECASPGEISVGGFAYAQNVTVVGGAATAQNATTPASNVDANAGVLGTQGSNGSESLVSTSFAASITALAAFLLF